MSTENIFQGHGQDFAAWKRIFREILSKEKLGDLMVWNADQFEVKKPRAAFKARDEDRATPNDDKLISSWTIDSRNYGAGVMKARTLLMEHVSSEIVQEIKRELKDIQFGTTLSSFVEMVEWIKDHHGKWTTEGERMRSEKLRIMLPWQSVDDMNKGIQCIQEMREQGEDWSDKDQRGRYIKDHRISEEMLKARLVELTSEWSKLTEIRTDMRSKLGTLSYDDCVVKLNDTSKLIREDEVSRKRSLEEVERYGPKKAPGTVMNAQEQGYNTQQYGYEQKHFRNEEYENDQYIDQSEVNASMYQQDACNNCGSSQHWVRDCPKPYGFRLRSHPDAPGRAGRFATAGRGSYSPPNDYRGRGDAGGRGSYGLQQYGGRGEAENRGNNNAGRGSEGRGGYNSQMDNGGRNEQSRRRDDTGLGRDNSQQDRSGGRGYRPTFRTGRVPRGYAAYEETNQSHYANMANGEYYEDHSYPDDAHYNP